MTLMPVLNGQRVLPQEQDEKVLDLQAKAETERRDTEFKKLKDACEKLRQLSSELKEMVEKSNPHTVSIAIIKKTDEIEKV
jgi:chromatin segregation and condensation protein Rec8/ScpA/Scc1 (kleisin family)